MTPVTLTQLQSEGKKVFPRQFKSGQTVRIHEKIIEGGKERIQIFEGLIIKTGGRGVGETITVRKVIGGIGVEKIISIHSGAIVNIEFVKEAKVRRSKIYFMRERTGKAAKLREKFLHKQEKQEIVEDKEEIPAEESKTEEAVTEKNAEETVQATEEVKQEEEKTEKESSEASESADAEKNTEVKPEEKKKED